MAEDILKADEEGMKSLLTMLYNNKPTFPIESDVDIINIFGGPLGSVQITKDEIIKLIREKYGIKDIQFVQYEEYSSSKYIEFDHVEGEVVEKQ